MCGKNSYLCFGKDQSKYLYLYLYSPFFCKHKYTCIRPFFLKKNIFVFAFLFNPNIFVISCNDTMVVTNYIDHYNMAKRENSKLEVVENFCALGIRGRHFIFP